MSSNIPQVVWFKRDLRVADHAPIALAAEAEPVVPSKISFGMLLIRVVCIVGG